MTTIHLNEVDLPAVGSLVEAIQGDPVLAQTVWKSEVTWDGAFRTSARSRHLAPTSFDEPPGLGGTDTAPNPVEQILAALGSCLVIGYAANASAAGIEITDLKIEVEGDVRRSQPGKVARFDWAGGESRVMVTFEGKGPGRATAHVAPRLTARQEPPPKPTRR